MHLVKWLRKNNTKLMAVVVILIMFAFIIPSVLRQLARPALRAKQIVAYYGTDDEITTTEIAIASRELDILRRLSIPRFLLAQLIQGSDINAGVLSQMLFPESIKEFPPVAVNNLIKRIVNQKQIPLSSVQIDDFFSSTGGRSELYWILLKAEAHQAGSAVSLATAGDVLKIIIPQITDRQLDAKALIDAIAQSNQLTQEAVIRIFADLLNIMTYGDFVTKCENVTIAQMRNAMLRQGEKINVEFVEVKAEPLIDQQPEPLEDQLAQHFKKYKGFTPGLITPENPYGLGYKLGPRAAIEYIALLIDDVEKLITPPAEEDLEEYYLNNIQQFTTSVAADPNDPNSEMIDKRSSYAEVASSIRTGLLQRRINGRANMILNEAKAQLEAGFGDLEPSEITSSELKAASVDFSEVARSIGQKHGIEIHTGKTDLLTMLDMQTDRYLGTFSLQGQVSVPLVKVVFAVEELQATRLGPFEVPTPKMYENIGPMSDFSGEATAIVRIVDIAEAAEPDSIDLKYKRTMGKIGDTEEADDEDFYLLKDQLIRDCKIITAMDTASARALELVELVNQSGWDTALNEFNNRYSSDDVNDITQSLQLQTWQDRTRLSDADIYLSQLRAANIPIALRSVSNNIAYKKLLDELYSHLDPNQTEAKTPILIEFKPNAGYFVVKSLSRTIVGLDQYEKAKSSIALGTDYNEADSLVFVHYNPENIAKRMQLKFPHEIESVGQANQAQTKGTVSDETKD